MVARKRKRLLRSRWVRARGHIFCIRVHPSRMQRLYVFLQSWNGILTVVFKAFYGCIELLGIVETVGQVIRVRWWGAFRNPLWAASISLGDSLRSIRLSLSLSDTTIPIFLSLIPQHTQRKKHGIIPRNVWTVKAYKYYIYTSLYSISEGRKRQ